MWCSDCPQAWRHTVEYLYGTGVSVGPEVTQAGPAVGPSADVWSRVPSGSAAAAVETGAVTTGRSGAGAGVVSAGLGRGATDVLLINNAVHGTLQYLASFLGNAMLDLPSLIFFFFLLAYTVSRFFSMISTLRLSTLR